MNIDVNKLAEDLAKLGKEHFDASEEARHMIELLKDGPILSLASHYEYVRTIDAGGSGIVLEVRDTSSGTNRAMKLSRKSAGKPIDIDPENPVQVDLERDAMYMVSHDHITRLYDASTTEDGDFCFVTQLIQKGTVGGTIDKHVEILIKEKAKGREPPEVIIKDVLIALGIQLRDVANALGYMHSELELFHMDVKPGNLLVDHEGRAYVTDLGFARCKRKYEPMDKVPVGFTYGYAHPRLFQEGKFRAPSTWAKARNVIRGEELGPRFDLYAFGRTILALLRQIERRYGERVKGVYEFSYLHLLATLLLDCRNTEVVAQADNQQHFMSEVALGVKENLLQQFTITDFSDVQERLERLLNHRPLEAVVPELDQWYPRTINHGTGYLAASPRVQSLIDHPLFQRLRDAKQLGIADYVYPSATHTRFAHALGVCDFTCQYLSSLYYDHENPIFRLLVEPREASTVLVAALVHDLGQSEFGHELEELAEGVFSHEAVTKYLLDDNTVKDGNGRSLQDVIKGTASDEWNVPVAKVIEMLEKRGSGPRFALFREILDGPVDADKLDWLQRDGTNCNLAYPQGLDTTRFLHSLTAMPGPKTGDRSIRLGIREKGLASAESITFARHKMYQASYLQHTVRCIKAMILSACARSLAAMQKELGDATGTGLYEYPLTEMFACHLANLDYAERLSSTRTRDPSKRVWQTIRRAAAQFREEYEGLDRSVSFFFGHMDATAKMLIHDAINRPIYRRLSEVSLGELSHDGAEAAIKAFGWAKREDTLGAVQKRLVNAAEKVLQDRTALWPSLNVDPEAATLADLVAKTVVLVADVPLRSLGTGGSPPPVLKDIARKRGDFEFHEGHGGLGHIWREGMDKMMREISVCRIFCHPRVHAIITGCLGQGGIDKIISEGLPFWSRR